MATGNEMKTAAVSEEMASKFATEKETPYTRWVKAEGLEIGSAIYQQDLHAIELRPWARRGGRGVFLNHDASRTSNDAYVCEIPPGKQLAPQRQLFEEMIYVLDGRGSTTVWNDAGAKVTLRVEGGCDLRDPAQHQPPAFQRLREGAGALRLGDQRPGDHQRLRRPGFRLQHEVRLQGPVQRRARLLRQQGRAEGPSARHQFRRRRDQPAR